MKQSIIIFLSIFIIFLCIPVFAQKDDPKAVEIVRNAEKLQDLTGLDVTSQFTLIQKREGETDRVLKINIYRRDAKDVFTIIFNYPDSEKGKGYFRSGDGLYFYLPSTREFTYRNRKDDIGSTDVRTDIFSRPQTLKQYNVKLAGTEKISEWECDVIRLDAKVPDVSFPVQKWYVRKTDGLPVKVENYSLSETLLRVFYYISYENLKPGKVIVTRLLAVDPLEKGQKTLVSNENVSIKPIPDYVFSKAFLEEQSR